MDAAQFQNQAPGRLVALADGACAFDPDPLPPDLDRSALFDAYGAAMAGIGSLNAKIVQIANPNLVIQPLQRREALTSSSMEGTYSTSDELALLEAGAEDTASTDTREVRNYVSALTHAVGMMDELPICHRLIKETHAKLLAGLPFARGGKKRPGEYKTEQNWIGGATPAQARFVPPPPAKAARAMDALEAFINWEAPESIPPLLEAALVHYQFETIHPFVDGNGRVGRILIPLILLARGTVSTPVFYPSASLEGRKTEYIDRMFAVSAEARWTEWLLFFLEVCADTCANSVTVVDRILTLQTRYRQEAMDRFRSNNVLVLIDQLFINPAISVPAARSVLGVTHRAARMTIANLEEIGVLEKMPGTSMPEYFVAREILRAGS